MESARGVRNHGPGRAEDLLDLAVAQDGDGAGRLTAGDGRALSRERELHAAGRRGHRELSHLDRSRIRDEHDQVPG